MKKTRTFKNISFQLFQTILASIQQYVKYSNQQICGNSTGKICKFISSLFFFWLAPSLQSVPHEKQPFCTDLIEKHVEPLSRITSDYRVRLMGSNRSEGYASVSDSFTVHSMCYIRRLFVQNVEAAVWKLKGHCRTNNVSLLKCTKSSVRSIFRYNTKTLKTFNFYSGRNIFLSVLYSCLKHLKV